MYVFSHRQITIRSISKVPQLFDSRGRYHDDEWQKLSAIVKQFQRLRGTVQYAHFAWKHSHSVVLWVCDLFLVNV